MEDMPDYNALNTAPLWKQSLLILLALFPAIMLETLYLFPHFTSFNPVFTRFLGAIAVVCSLSWILMPMTLCLLGWWLKPTSIKRKYLGLFMIVGLYLIEICFFLLLS